VHDSVAAGIAVARHLHDTDLAQVVRAAFVHGMDLTLIVSAAVVAAGAVLAALFLPRRRPSPTAGQPASREAARQAEITSTE
jgi:MFS transporter, DHA2 family, multidrug resistance protein